jgi:hypothetical protein
MLRAHISPICNTATCNTPSVAVTAPHQKVAATVLHRVAPCCMALHRCCTALLPCCVCNTKNNLRKPILKKNLQ